VPTPTWPEYLDRLERWLDALGPELAARATAASAGEAPDPGDRPAGTLPRALQARALALLARLEEVSVAGERRRDELVAARLRLDRRRRAAAGRGRVNADL
jgi:hypothetical protein